MATKEQVTEERAASRVTNEPARLAALLFKRARKLYLGNPCLSREATWEFFLLGCQTVSVDEERLIMSWGNDSSREVVIQSNKELDNLDVILKVSLSNRDGRAVVSHSIQGISFAEIKNRGVQTILCLRQGDALDGEKIEISSNGNIICVHDGNTIQYQGQVR